MSNDISFKSTPKVIVFEHAAIDAPTKRPSLNDMLASFDPKRHGGEAMAFKTIGREAIAKV